MTRTRLLIASASACGLIVWMIAGCNPVPNPAGSARYHAGADSLAYEARLGRVLWLRYCVICHGSEGRGDGFNAFNLDPHPRNISDPAFQESVDDRRLKEIIRYGGTLRGGSPHMPAWGRTLNDQDLTRLTEFIRYLKRRP